MVKDYHRREKENKMFFDKKKVRVTNPFIPSEIQESEFFETKEQLSTLRKSLVTYPFFNVLGATIRRKVEDKLFELLIESYDMGGTCCCKRVVE